jgi:hypothetical protein
MADHSLAPDRGQRNRFAIMKIVCINAPAQRAELVMSDLFDVSKEIILVTGASQGLGRQFARVLAAHGAAVALGPVSVLVNNAGIVVTVDGDFC